ncbi:MAG: glycoside hydrolase family 38 C-terminal domain-containing protein, partial [Eubacteriales bacterium]|nr:glycoside hydrolase family 38 C-terminal domain-containing protein [Eubacteriales bacterium]
IEEYEPELFERIQKLVADGKWHIMGGWYLQPDCTMLSGESFIRQIEYGRKYFKEKFDKTPTTAINFDPFGHTRGLVQILKKNGFDSYLFMRPGTDRGDFVWRGFDGSEILGHCHYGGYNTLKGDSVEKIEYVLKECADKENILVLWGIGDHGGGPSKTDLRNITEFMKEHDELNIKHSTPEEYFKTVNKDKLKVIEKSLGPCMMGCYTSMVRIKQANRHVENKIEMMKRMTAQSGISVDDAEIESAEKALMLSQFHDVLPGSMIKKAETDSLNEFGYAEKICDKYIAKAFFKLCDGQKKCKSGEIPVIVYNPLPYTIEKEIEIEFQLENQNWNEDETTIVKVKDENGNYLPSQNEKEDCTFSLDWRKKVIFRAKLKPMRMNRFNCELEVKKNYDRIAKPSETDEHFCVKNDRMTVKINKKTGLISEYTVDGKSRLKPNSGAINVYADNEDPWGMTANGFYDKLGEFKLMSDYDANRFNGYYDEKSENVRVIENDDVRMKIQTLFEYEKSVAVVTYTVPKYDAYIDINVHMFSNDVNRAYKLTFKTDFENGKFMGQTAFGTEELVDDKSEVTFHNWCGKTADDNEVYILNNGTYGGSGGAGEISMTLLRTPVYSAHPIGKRRIAPHDRFLDHIDMGERVFEYRITTEKAVDKEAELFNMPPYSIPFFPSGNGEAKDCAVEIGNENIMLSTLQRQNGGIMFRLFNTQNIENTADVFVFGTNVKISLAPFEYKTYMFMNNKIYEITE